MKFLRAILAPLIAFAASPGWASTPFPIPLKEIYAEADTVAVVEIVEGRLVAAGGESCGARYKGRVIEGTKSATAGAFIEFGYLTSLKLGTAYLVLLGKFEDSPIQGVPDFQTRCKSALPPATILAHWRGVMEIAGDTGTPAKRESWTVHPPKYVIFPLGTRTTAVEGEKQFWFSDLVSRLKGEK